MTTAAGLQSMVGIAVFIVVMSPPVLSSHADGKIAGCECKQPGRGGVLGKGGLGWLLKMAPCPPVWRPELLLSYCRILPCWATSTILARCLGLPDSTTTTSSTVSASPVSSAITTTNSSTFSFATSSTIIDLPRASTATFTWSSSTGPSPAPPVKPSSMEWSTDSVYGATTSLGNAAKTLKTEVYPRVEHSAESKSDDLSTIVARIYRRSNTVATHSVPNEVSVKSTPAISTAKSTRTAVPPSAITASTESAAASSSAARNGEAGSMLAWPCSAVLELLGRCRAVRDLPCPALQLLTRHTLQACPACTSTSSSSSSTQSFPSSTLYRTAPPGASPDPALNVTGPQGEDRKEGGERTWTGVSEVETAGKVAREATSREIETEEGQAVRTGGRSALVALATCFALVWCVAIGLLITYRPLQCRESVPPGPGRDMEPESGALTDRLLFLPKVYH